MKVRCLNAAYWILFGKITWIATQEMVLPGKAELCLSFLQIGEILEARGGGITGEPLFSLCY